MSMTMADASIDRNNNTQAYVFRKPEYASRTMANFAVYLRQGFLCDIVFVCDGGQSKRRIAAHRLVVSTLSEHFRAMFENAKHQQEISLNQTDADVFEQLILYAYEGKRRSLRYSLAVERD